MTFELVTKLAREQHARAKATEQSARRLRELAYETRVQGLTRISERFALAAHAQGTAAQHLKVAAAQLSKLASRKQDETAEPEQQSLPGVA